MSIKTLGVDLGKLSCHVIGQDQRGKNRRETQNTAW